MKSLRIVAPLLVLLLVVPEFPRFAAERRLRRITDATTVFATDPRMESVRTRALRRVLADALALETYPGDWRVPLAAANAALLAGDRDAAVASLQRALTSGERAEIDANLGLVLHPSDESARLLERAAWLAPALSPMLEARTGLPLRARGAELERKLRDGSLRPGDLPPPPASLR